ncbi:polysaccharide pyruvyl transferase family protein [Vibrio parahaemolyticus]|uniref:polysaccharide pyruvyl transferase family protein n=2 Tax=Vibrio parahaemolyticus TaxID=670 RepID=UPI000C7AC78B|nr:polysaccharide pyruvyl transferase family protein [Vibrio parahaemolyticus]EGR1584862.1 polysaccharide pyruvyl transferase family protein [Vibrio parahaemolyticus]EGR3402178.1 polysaccharide pyruvyl transferase family protein [Vibrio parahaemolyticus]EHZ7318441.1 polysaccharide pyruvyl transferase family protein [Vibrio parahaemolyticus]EIA4666050.1 polysaccharide pyruvyl transferase family protein [Vibrio parahaemolyticus]EIC2726374.1 polysaccharide pyruvyl transferase family protein [Vibr
MKSKNNVLLSTIYKADNYGAIFQALSLSEYLKSEYNDVYVLDYSPSKINRQYSPLRTYSIKAALKDVFRFFPRKRMLGKITSFINENFNEMSIESAKQKEFDALVTGSDQVWNPAIVSFNEEFEPCYFFDGIKGLEKISYASSLGSYRYNEQQGEQFKKYISEYDRIAIREEDSTKYISDSFGVNATHVLDPTLIQNRLFWEDLITSNSFDVNDYILVYFNNYTEELATITNRLKNLTNKKVVVINNWYAKNIDSDLYIRDAGPIDFLELFSKAKYVVTNTFHGVCFSINFEKDFLYVDNGVHSNRVESLLGKLSAGDKIVSDVLIKDEILLSKLSHLVNKEMLELEKNKSIAYLKGKN